MTRLGWLLLLAFAIVIGGFALLVRRGGSVRTAPATPAGGAPAGGTALVVPVSGVAPGQLADTWGQARAGGVREHHALDIPAPRGTPVIAAAGGTVEKLFESGNGGHTAYVRRADPRWIDYYAHLDGYATDLREGVAVRQGQPLGIVGSTGDADPAAPHLHYEIKRMGPGEKWWQGTNIDPYPLLAGKPAGG